MHVTIDRKTDQVGMIFKKDRHKIQLTVVFSEEEKFAIKQAGINEHIFYTEPNNLTSKIEDADAVRLFSWRVKHLLKGKTNNMCVVWNLVDLNDEEAKIREGLTNLKSQIEATKVKKGKETFEL